MFKKALIGTFALLGSIAVISPAASAWNATYLQGQNWAITCADGLSYSYHGSSAGLDTVGPALCPGGISSPGGDVIMGEISKFENQAAQTKAANSTGFPPHGYPCLGCEPCPNDETEFCSTTDGIAIPNGDVVWSTQGMDRKTADIMKERYNLNKIGETRYERGRPARPSPRMQRR